MGPWGETGRRGQFRTSEREKREGAVPNTTIPLQKGAILSRTSPQLPAFLAQIPDTGTQSTSGGQSHRNVRHEGLSVAGVRALIWILHGVAELFVNRIIAAYGTTL